jgi:cholesterol transport system auxiliary component
MKTRILIAIVLTAALCAGCTGSLFDSDIPASSNYVLAPVPPAATETVTAASTMDISIGRPDVAPGLDTQRIAVLKGRQLDYFRGARWSGSTNETVQSLIVNSLQDQRLFRSVTSEQARIAGDYVLDIDVRDFQAEYAGNGNPSIRVSVIGRLIRVSDRELAGTVSAAALRPATEDRLSAVISAFESAAQQVALELAQKTATLVADDVTALRTKK